MEFSYRQVTYNGNQVSIPVSRYRYQPLNLEEREIRLLEILPAPDFEDSIRCRLAHHFIDKPPFYTALSYLWGDPSRWSIINIGGTPFPVGLNLEAALRQLRLRRCPLVWIDAICIDQQNLQERTTHIRYMKDVYHQADYVSLWLGDEAYGSTAVMNMLHAIDVSRQPEKLKNGFAYTPSSEDIQRSLVQLGAFFSRAVWERVWIIQEIASGSRIKLLCGLSEADWRGLEILLPLLEDTPNLEATYLESLRYLIMRRKVNLDGKQLGLLQALYDTRSAQATDIRDKVFALHGLTSDVLHFIRTPSYNWIEREMCFHMTESAIWAKKSLDPILAATHSKNTSSLPSWTPDYLHFGTSSYPRTFEEICTYISRENECWRAGNFSRRWNATSGSVPDRFSLQFYGDSLLTTRGFPFGIINGITAEATGNSAPQSQLPATADTKLDKAAKEQMVSKLGAAYTIFSKHYGGQKSRPTFTRFLWEFDSPISYHRSDIKRLKENIPKLLEWRERNKRFLVHNQELKEYTKYTLPPATQILRGSAAAGYVGLLTSFVVPQPWGIVAEYAASMGTGVLTTMKGRHQGDLVECLYSLQGLINEGMRLITTVEDYVGWAHPAAHLGDEIFLLQGCSVPVILRRSSQDDYSYKLVGHAYVEGVMNGELWSTLQENQFQQVVIS